MVSLHHQQEGNDYSNGANMPYKLAAGCSTYFRIKGRHEAKVAIVALARKVFCILCHLN